MIKDRIIRWAVRQIVKDGEGTYAQMRYLEDVVENEFGEKQFIFAHKLVPPNPRKRNRPSNATRFSGAFAAPVESKND